MTKGKISRGVSLITILTCIFTVLVGCSLQRAIPIDDSSKPDYDTSDSALKYDMAEISDTANMYDYDSIVVIKYNTTDEEANVKEHTIEINSNINIAKGEAITDDNISLYMKQERLADFSSTGSLQIKCENGQTYFTDDTTKDWVEIPLKEIVPTDDFPLLHNIAADLDIEDKEIDNNDIRLKGTVETKYVKPLFRGIIDFNGDLGNSRLPITINLEISNDKLVITDFTLDLKELFNNTTYTNDPHSKTEPECQSFIMSVVIHLAKTISNNPNEVQEIID